MKKMLMILILVLSPLLVMGESESITATHRYIMGDNDSKNDARRMCFLEAKRKVLAKAGAYIESNTTIRNYQLAKDEITSYSAALLKIETIKEDWEITGRNMSVTLTVKADVDVSILEKQLAKIRQDKSVQTKIKSQSAKLQELEKTVTYLQKQLGSTHSTNTPVLRKDRNVVFKQIDELEEKKAAIVERVRKRTRDARTLITKGMTRADVVSLIGNPDSKNYTYAPGTVWKYGTTTIEFDNEKSNATVESIR
jgi:hypothetical protein